MLARVTQRLTYANVVGSLALFIALGGTAYAAAELSKNSVRAKHIPANAVGGGEVKDRSLRLGDIAPSQAPTGPTGEQGVPGAAGLASSIVREVTKQAPATCTPSVTPGVYQCLPTAPTTILSCEPGERAIYANGLKPVTTDGIPTGFEAVVPVTFPTAPTPTIEAKATMICAR
jgi:hypothetical protein